MERVTARIATLDIVAMIQLGWHQHLSCQALVEQRRKLYQQMHQLGQAHLMKMWINLVNESLCQ
jgi:hypothetical protein